jgi:transglutaminase-like putative cysteine protease
LQWGEWTGLVLIVLLPLLALRVLEIATSLRTSGATPLSAIPLRKRLLAPLRGHLARIALALPLAAALFVFFPRIPGPLWDIGLSFGLPLSLGLEKSSQGLGVSTRLKPGQGQTQTGVSENRPVLVAEFENWVPPTSLLYWRGPVYYDFDGKEWRLDPEYEAGQGRALMRRGWARGDAFSATLTRKTHEIRYTIRLTPHDRLWLYGLDLPAALAAESFISADWQVLAHRPVEAETSYRLKSWLEWEAGGGGASGEAALRRALALPETGNPRLRALGAELAARPPEERVKTALAALAREGYKVRDRFEFREGPDALDAFWFDGREGNADLYAGTFVFLMRAAGVPARLVTGYRGGKLMALTDYVIVKKNHAHAWTEIWDTTRGWQRVDPVDLIAPERFADGQQGRQTRPATQPESQPTSPPQPPEAARASRQSAAHLQAMPSAGPSSSATQPGGGLFGLRGPGGLEDFFARWVFHLNGETQQSLLSTLGEKLGEKPGGKFAWVWLLVGAALASALTMIASAFLTGWRDARRLPAPQHHWNRLARLLAKRGLRREVWECPNAFARRVAAARPLWAMAMTALANAYADWRYDSTGIRNQGSGIRDTDDAAERVKISARKLYNLILADTAAPRQTNFKD